MKKNNYSTKVRSRNRLYFLLLVFVTNFSIFAQEEILEIPNTNEFKPQLEHIESKEYGIHLYDQYATFHKEPLIRKDANGNPITAKQEDFFSEGTTLHKGIYLDGKLRSYTNFFPNGNFERNYKYKTDGTGELQVFFNNGYYRSIQKYANFNAYLWEDYYENGKLAYIEKRNKKSNVPELIQENDYKGNTISLIEISDSKKLIFIKTVYFPNGKLAEQGNLVYSKELQDFRKDGTYFTYNTLGKPTSEVVYQMGMMKEVVLDNRPDEEKDYLKISNEEVTTISNEQKENSKVPEAMQRFDRDQNDEISSKEMDLAVNDFFEDDSISLELLNALVNFFFDQE